MLKKNKKQRENNLPEEFTDAASSDYFSRIVNRFDAGYKQNREFIYKYQLMSQLIKKYSQPGDVAMDYGCGTGIFTKVLAETCGRVVGLDASAKMIEFCRQTSDMDNVEYHCSSILKHENIEIESVDLCICFHVLEYIEDWQVAMSEMISGLKSPGTMIVTCPNPDSVARIGSAALTRTFKIVYEFQKVVKNRVTMQEFLQFATQYPDLDVVESHYYGVSLLGDALKLLRFPEHRVGSSFFVVLRKR